MAEGPHDRRDEPVTEEPAARRGGRDRSGMMAAIGAIVLVLLLLFLALFAFGDDDDNGADQQQDVDVTQTVGDDEAGSDDANVDADTEDQIIIEAPEGGDGADAEAIAQGGDVIDQESGGDTPEVNVLVDREDDIRRFDGATFRAPTNSQMTMRFENETNEPYNAYVSAGEGEISPTLASMEPAVQAGETREETFTTPPAAGTYSIRIEDVDGNMLMEATIELEER